MLFLLAASEGSHALVMDSQGHLHRGRVLALPCFVLALAVAVATALGAGTSFGQAPAAKRPSASASKAPVKKGTNKKRAVRASRARGQAAPTSGRIREIQAALATAGHYASEPSGKWDAASAEAMRSFQEAQGLRPTGKLDALTLQRLGLGSPAAGVAAPRATAATSSHPTR